MKFFLWDFRQLKGLSHEILGGDLHFLRKFLPLKVLSHENLGWNLNFKRLLTFKKTAEFRNNVHFLPNNCLLHIDEDTVYSPGESLSGEKLPGRVGSQQPILGPWILNTLKERKKVVSADWKSKIA